MRHKQASLRNYVHGAAIDELLSKTNASGTVYYHQDGLGSTVALTDATGKLVERYAYDVFGAPTLYNASGSVIPVSSVANRFFFTGREGDPQTGLYDYRNRVYSSSLGRFLQTDPIRFDAGDGNLYRYVQNNSITLIDSTGEAWSWGAVAVGAAAGAAYNTAASITSQAIGGNGINWGTVGSEAAQGAVAGAVVGAIVGAVTGDPTALAAAAAIGAAAVGGAIDGAMDHLGDPTDENTTGCSP